MTREEYEKVIDEKLRLVKQELVEEFEKKSRLDDWEDGQEYYFINDIGYIEKSNIDKNSYVCIYRIRHGNAFKTFEDAEFEQERKNVIYELSKFAEPEDATWDGKTKHHRICYDIDIRKITVNCNTYCIYDEIYFNSKEVGEKAIEAVGEKRVKKYYLKIKE